MKKNKSLLFRLTFSFLSLISVFSVLSCFQNDPEKSTDLIFRLDSTLIDKFDSLKIEILTSNTPRVSIWVRNFKLNPGQREIRLAKPPIVPKDFVAIISGFKSGLVIYVKQFNYAGKTVTLSYVAPDSVTIAAFSGSIFDTLTPKVQWWPRSVTDSSYTLNSLDTTIVTVIGKRLLAQALGTAQVVFKSTGNASVTAVIDVTVRKPEFQTEIKPITTQWCGACHSPLITFNLQDSVTLVSKGSKALYRLQLPITDTGYMPANKTELNPRDKSMLLYWLNQNAKPVIGVDVFDTTIALGDSILPNVLFTPSDATNRGFTLVSANNTKLTVVGKALVAYEIGLNTVEVTSTDGGFKKTFNVTVVVPQFEANIKPITTSKCGTCHSPTRTFDLQDSAVLLKKGAAALLRIQLPVSNPNYMPADTNIKMPPREVKALVGWLNAYFVKLNGVFVTNMVLKLGETKVPTITFDPPNASNRNYHLILTDTNKIKTISGLEVRGDSVTSPISVVLETEESKLTKAFTVAVTPIAMDSIRGVDTGGAISDTVFPRINFYPNNVTDTNWTLKYLLPLPPIATLLPGNKSLKGSTLGTAKIEVASAGTPTIKDTFDFAVGPIRLDSLKAQDQTVTIGSIFSPAITWYPPATTNKSYKLSIPFANTANLRIYPIDTASPTPRLEATGVDTVTVTLSAKENGDTAQFTVTIGNVKVTAVKLSLPAGRIYVDSPVVYYTPTVTWAPTNATIKTFTLSTGTPSLVAVLNKGAPLTPPSFRALALGTGRITASSTDGPKDSVTFTIYRPPFSKVQAILQKRCFPCHQGGMLSNPRIVDSVVALGPSIILPTVLMKDEIIRRIKLSVVSPDHMPADGTALGADTLAILTRYFSW